MPLDEGFLAMLTATATWEPNTGKDTWGNEQYGPPQTVVTAVTSQTKEFGGEDGQSKQDGPVVTTMELITDSVGIALKDRITVSGAVLYVTHVDTPKDELGVDLMHTVTASSTEKG